MKETSLEALSALRPAFKKDGTVTAGNSSKISDGAAALVLMSGSKVRELGVKPLFRVGAQGASGLDPKYVLVAPLLSIPKVLKKAGLTVADIDLQEVNEAFSASTVAVIRELGLDPEKTNVHGGSVALGHPDRGQRRPGPGHPALCPEGSSGRAGHGLPLPGRRGSGEFNCGEPGVGSP